MSSLYAHIIDVPTGVRYFKADKEGLSELTKYLTVNNLINPKTSFEVENNISIKLITTLSTGKTMTMYADTKGYVSLDDETIKDIRCGFKDPFEVPLGKPILTLDYEDDKTRELKKNIQRAERRYMEYVEYPFGLTYSEKKARRLANTVQDCKQELKDYLASLS